MEIQSIFNKIQSIFKNSIKIQPKGMITGDYQLRRTGLANVFSLALGPPADEAQADQGA
jgi:hypothetical protein